jgi:putative ABC transport system permease protein
MNSKLNLTKTIKPVLKMLRPIEKILKTDILISDIFEVTFQRIKSKRLRSFLTILGIGVGIGVVYFLVSLTFGLQKLVIGRIATSESLLSLDVIPNTEIKDFVKLNSKVLTDVKALENVEEVSGVKSLPGELVYNDIKTQTLVYGAEESYFRLSGINADSGELYRPGDESKMVVSSAILSLFNLDKDKILGTRVRLSLILTNETGVREVVPTPEDEDEATASATVADDSLIKVVEIPVQFTVVGVIEDDSNYIYIPQKDFSVVSLDEYKIAKVKVSDRESINGVRDEIMSRGFLVTAMTDTLQQINNIFRITQITFTVVGIVALFIAAIGMLNTMTVSLLERTREIGIMKAIGATEKGIKQMFLMESVMMGLGGGLGGLILGFVFSKVVGVLVNLLALSLGGESVNIFYTPGWFILLVFGFSFLIGIITGIFPARRAAKLNPLDALRYE